MRLSGKSVIVFDWDGTLFDSMPYKRANFCALFSELSNAGRDEMLELHSRFSGLPRRTLFEHVAVALRGTGLSEPEFQALSLRYTGLNIDSSRRVSPFADALHAVPLLRASGFRLYVSSSSAPEELVPIVENSGFAGSFAQTLGSRPRFNKGKEHIAHIAGVEGAGLEKLLFVGDDQQDLTLGSEAGVDTLRVVRQQGQATGNVGIIESLAALVTDQGRA